MVTAICIGIVKSGSPHLSQIPCAGEDASRVYHALADVTLDSFDHIHSVCLTDSLLAEVQSYIGYIARNLTPEDTLVLYYSGHGALMGSELVLEFADAAVGRVTTKVIAGWLDFCKAHAIIVLDCCHAGIALGMANKADPFKMSRTSVLASTRAYDASTFTESASEFTRAFCAALALLHEKASPLSLSVIAKLIRQKGVAGCVLNLAEDQVEVVIPSSAGAVVVPTTFPVDYVRRLSQSRQATREILWYSLSTLPVDIRIACLWQYFGYDLPSEPSWLVRRAIGSVLWSCRLDRVEWRRLVERLLVSPNWMEVCIGLIGTRVEIGQPGLKEIGCKIVASETPIDAVWLAHLYLSEVDGAALELALNSRLTGTPWGMVDVASRHIRGAQDVQKVLTIVREYQKDEELLCALGTDLRCRGLPSSVNAWQLPYDPAVTTSPLVGYLYSGDRRGAITDPSAKWLLSFMYGSWRDQLQERVVAWLTNHPVEQCKAQLELCGRAPAVEVRMAVFQDLGNSAELFGQFKEHVAWGLRDPHPWVRREALLAFRADTERASRAANGLLVSTRYPGRLDLILTAQAVGAFPVDRWAAVDLTGSEKRAMNWAVAVEKYMPVEGSP